MRKTASNVTWTTIRSREHWSPELAQRVLADLKRSGLSARGYAAKRKISLKRLSYWQTRLEARGSRTEAGAELVEVRVSGPTDGNPSRGSTRIEVELLNGRRLSVEESVDLKHLGRLVTLLEQA